MQTHSNATTNQNQRRLIQSSAQSYSLLVQRFMVSKSTVCRWKQRRTVEDRSCRPHKIVYALTSEEEALVLSLRGKHLSLDEVLDAAQVVLPHVRRASVHRLFVRHGVQRLPKKQQEPEAGQTGAFKEYGPGYLHIDFFHLPKLDNVKRYCFVAVDRATRLVYLAAYEQKSKETATEFLRKCLDFYPFRIEKILTDNGREFTLEGFKNRWGVVKDKTKDDHPFGQLCLAEGIEHRRTRPYTPKTNGMVERMNGLIKENTTKKHSYQTTEEMLASLKAWFVRYNFCRKNRQIGRITPYEAALRWYDKEPGRFIRKPAELLLYRSQSTGT